MRRREVDEDKLALAFLMLARVLHEDAEPNPAAETPGDHGADDAEVA